MAFMTIQCFDTTNSVAILSRVDNEKFSLATNQHLINNRKTKKQISEDYFEPLKEYDEEYNNKFVTIFHEMNNVSKESILPNEEYNVSSEKLSVSSLNTTTELYDSNHN